jgi:hypothetical protein
MKSASSVSGLSGSALSLDGFIHAVAVEDDIAGLFPDMSEEGGDAQGNQEDHLDRVKHG